MMIEKLEDVLFTDENKNKLARRPNHEEIIAKLNEIIEFLNAQPHLLDK